jgi:hypothetical protein
MYLVTTSLYPSDKAKEVAEVYLKCIVKYPDDKNVSVPIVPVAARGTFQGIKTVVIYEAKKGKLDEAMDVAVKRLAMFHDIPGYRYSLETFLTLEEGLNLIGM